MRVKVEDDILDAIAKLEDLELSVKVLLVHDGTLEYILSIMSNGINFKVIRQVEYDDHIEREVILKGCYTINASSIIYKDALPKDVLDDIRCKEMGIGRILRKHRIETFKKIIEIGYEDSPYRVYEIIHNGKVAFKIKEIIS